MQSHHLRRLPLSSVVQAEQAARAGSVPCALPPGTASRASFWGRRIPELTCRWQGLTKSSRSGSRHWLCWVSFRFTSRVNCFEISNPSVRLHHICDDLCMIYHAINSLAQVEKGRLYCIFNWLILPKSSRKTEMTKLQKFANHSYFRWMLPASH